MPGPPFMEMATPIISATSSVVAPRRAQPHACAATHPSHSRVMEMASAISSLVLADSAPSLKAAECMEVYPVMTSGSASRSAR